VCNGDGAVYGDTNCCESALDECGVCNGVGIDADADGICDDIDECIGGLDECGVCNGPGIPEGECDCNGALLPEGECDCNSICSDGSACTDNQCVDGSDCTSHIEDECGVCNGGGAVYGIDTNCCESVLDECGICNGSGAILGCGCYDIPEGDCDCDGNVRDECGICGGSGVDIDQDGICDDVDDCVSEGANHLVYDTEGNEVEDPSNGGYDECGICNGLGSIYECGCYDISDLFALACDCSGNVLDECGMCGGDNSSCADCAGVPNGDLEEDDCGTCDNDPTNDCEEDCAGVWGGDLIEDECGECGGPGAIFQCGCTEIPISECDCDGNVLDDCGVCGGSGIPDGFCDCDYNVLDVCGVCGGIGIPEGLCNCGGSPIPENECDCNSISGTDTDEDDIADNFEPHVLDECGECNGDGEDIDQDGLCDYDDVDDCVSLGSDHLIFDAEGNEVEDPFLGGYDQCGECNGVGVDVDADDICDDEDECVSEGTEGLIYDADGNAVEDPLLGGYDQCGECNGPGAIYECFQGEYVGTTGGCYDIPPGACDCSGHIVDCAGECDGTAIEDECGVCDGNGFPEGFCNCDSTSEIPEDQCDCDGNVLDGCGECGGSGVDIDQDGLCDDIDDCVSEGTEGLIYDAAGNAVEDPFAGGYDECGLCNGGGAELGCGCYDAPEGDCDCDGNVLDDCGDCGGDQILDENGLFPETSFCDCDENVLDECGVCNGGGEIYECGCHDVPEGECDCFGSILDDCGVCGGDNSTCYDEWWYLRRCRLFFRRWFTCRWLM